MKKLFAILLALTLVMVSAVAFAADDAATTYKASAGTETFYIEKSYTVTNGSASQDTTVYPVETLTFTIANKENAGNPTGQTALPTVDSLTVNGATASATSDPKVNQIKVTLPAYTQPGVYYYTITEVPPTDASQGVTYKTDTKIEVVVVVGFDTTDKTQLKVTDMYGVIKENGEKADEITNEYKLGGLEVSKAVDGNLADAERKFPITVTLKAANTVRNDISYAIGTGTATTIAAPWTGEQPIDIELKAGETMVFKDIPEGVTYTVVEKDETSGGIKHVSAANVEPNNLDAYYVTGEAKTEASISSTTVGKVEIKNAKNFTIDTGIELDVLPYVMIMVIALAAAALLVVRRRREEI